MNVTAPVRLLLICYLLMGGSLLAQYSWSNLGPDNLGSKTRALAFDANGRLLAGSEGGGLWTSADQGLSWQRVSTYNGNPNITSISVDGSNIYVATGATQLVRSPYEALFPGGFDLSTTSEGFIGYTGLPGAGVFVSNDNGASWSNENGTTASFWGTLDYQGPFIGIQKVLAANGRVFIATRRGLFYSDDADLANVVPALGSQRFMNRPVYDVEVAANGVVFAGTSDSLYVSRDGGLSFQDAKNPGLFTLGRLSFQRVAIAVAPSDPNIVYVAGTRSNGELSGIWRSDDAGESWRNYAPSGNPGFTPLSTTGRDAFVLDVFPDEPDRVVVAGVNWYTFSQERGWTQTAQRFNPTADDYIPAKVYSLAFDPSAAGTFFIGTDFQVIRSTDNGNTFSQKTKGYEAGLTYQVTNVPISDSQAVVASTPINGTILNANYRSERPSAQGFGDIFPLSDGWVGASSIYPGSVIIQGPDEGLLRSPSFGTSFETFYGLPLSPQVDGLNLQDTIIDRQDNYLSVNSPTTNVLRDDNGPPSMPWLLDEVIPDAIIDQQAGKEEIQRLENYVFFCSRSYVWRVIYPLGQPDGLLPRWNRISNSLVSGSEFFTAMAISGDTSHTVYVGTSRGNLFRISRAHDLENFDATTNVQRISANLPPGRWISSIAVDPANTQRIAVTLAGYGGGVEALPSFLWYQDPSTAGFFFPVAGEVTREPMYASSFVEDPATGNTVLLVGTETGLYSYRAFPQSEVATRELGDEYGSIPVYDIHVQKYLATITDEETQDFTLQRDNTLFVATHGRGIWATEDLRFNRDGKQEPELTPTPEALQLRVFPNPTRTTLTLEIELPEAAAVSAQLYQVDGQAALPERGVDLEAGKQELQLNTARLARGIYVLRVSIATAQARELRHLKILIQ